MIALAKYFSSLIENGKRIIKSRGIGGSAMTTKECAPFGFDSQPLEGWTAIYAETTNKEEAVVVGYINKNQLVGAGESRMYAVGTDGQLLGYVYNRNDGVLGLNGFDHSSVRFGPLNTAIQAQNTLINAELAKIAVSIGLLGGTYTVAPISINLTTSESQTVKIK